MSKHISIPAISFFLVVLALSACAPKPVAKPAPAPKPAVAANVAPAIEDDILRLVNSYRQSKNLPPLTEHAVVAYEARRHSLDMATKKVPFSHDGFSVRMKVITVKIPGVKEVSENVAYGSMSAREVVDGWIKSSGHRKNIEGKYRFTGIGVARNDKSQLYFTQIFAN